ncbi:hypothetical protein [Zooshikella ganghwensis]|uniref:hypothetical protein n=1 Tax=Zooshikella ganghwensis TaxID=202772 RepID=UPI0004806C5E|nr:hypothetical protein [Zooshikella ganghwensis]
MTNIYKSPEAGIEKKEAEKLHFRSKTGWKVFFFIVLILEIISLLSLIFGESASLVNTLGEIVIYGLVLLGLYGFAFNKKILVRKFWFLMIFVAFFWDGYSMFYQYTELAEEQFLESVPYGAYFAIAIFAFFWLPFLIIQTIAFYKYSFRSPEIWNQ